MIILNERNQVKQAIKDWCLHYGLTRTYPMDKRGRKVGEELMALNPETATAKDVAEIIGNTLWAGPRCCSECGSETWDCVQLGEPPDYESATAWICKDCLKKALQLFGDE